MYDTLVAFLGEPPEGCEPFLYLASVAFALVLVSEFYSFLRIFVMRLVSKYARS
jgi:hypothetical protein